MSHTEGKLHLDGYWIVDESGNSVCYADNDENDDVNKANAHRLVACWNKLHLYPTAVIEESADVLVPQSMIDSAVKSIRERDELVKAADDLLSRWDNPKESEIGCYLDLFERFEALRRARVGKEGKS